MFIYSKDSEDEDSHKKSYNRNARGNGNFKKDAFRIDYDGLLCIQELEQALWEDMKQLQALGVKYIEHAKFYLPLVNEYGEVVYLRDEDGRTPQHWPSGAYRSLGTDYKL
jgi:hypothetical protein